MINYRSIAISAFLLMGLPVQSVFAGASITQSCDSDYPGQKYACVEQMMKQTDAALRLAEDTALLAIQQWDEAPSISLQSQNRLKATERTYRIYRGAQCGLVESLGDSNLSDAPVIAEMACVYEMNLGRISQLNQIKETLPKRTP